MDPKDTMYFVHNTIRARHNKSLRAAAPIHGGTKQYIGGQHRLIRGRPIALTLQQIGPHIEEIRAKAAAGAIEVRLADGRKVDLNTGRAVGEVMKNAPPPHPPLDSIANDKPAGEQRPQMAGGIPEGPTDPNQLPDLLISGKGAFGDETADNAGTEVEGAGK